MPEQSIKDLLSASQLAFTGVVEAAGRSTAGGVAADARTVVVRVDQVLHGPPALRLPPGSHVTVQLSPKLPVLEAGKSATFFVDGLVYGDTLVVSEVGRAPVAEAAPPTPGMAGLGAAVSPVQVAAAELASDEVVEHAREADAVLRGHVVGLASVPTDGPPREHEPNWWIATLEVDVLVRGELPGGTQAGGTVTVLYANSLDVQWRRWPKPKAGQSGLWLLHRTSPELADLAPFALSHPMDLQPSLQLDVLREHKLASPAPEETHEEEGEDA